MKPRALGRDPTAGRRMTRRERADDEPGTHARSSPLDLLTVLLMVTILCFVWRLQDLIPLVARLQVPTLSIAAATVAFVLDKDPRRTFRVWRFPVAKLAFLILGLMLLSVPFSLYPGSSLGFIRADHLKTLLLFGLVLGSIRSIRDLERFAWVQVAGASLYSTLIMFRFEVGPGGRLGNLYYYDANDLCLLLVCTVPFALYFIQRKGRPVRRVLAMLATGIILLAIVKTGSRGGFLGLLAVVATVLFAFESVPRRVRIGSVALVILGLSAVASDQYWDSMGTLLNPTQDYNWAGQQETGRMEIWKRGLGYMVAHPITGVGVRQFSRAEGTISPLIEDRARVFGPQWKYFNAPHNVFVQIGAELGVMGLLAFIALLWRSYRAATSRRRDRPPVQAWADAATLGEALGAGFVGFVVAGFFLSHAYMAFLYVLVAFAGAYGKIASADGSLHDALASSMVRSKR